MPPKQKQPKKGPIYKVSTPMKDMVPPTVKQPPRQPRFLKAPQIQTSTQKNIVVGVGSNEMMALFEQWPNEQVIKNHDFGGGASENKFQDRAHTSLVEYLGNEMGGGEKIVNWKYLSEVQNIQGGRNSDEEQSDRDNREGVKSTQNLKEEGKENQSMGKKVVVIETYLRQETQEQMDKRKKEEAELAEKVAKDKKKGKKQQPKEEVPLQVSDVKMSNILIKKYMCASGIWIGSLLQMIKIRQLKDVYTKQPIWKKIYPQENGVPQISKSGKYWVKLYYLGKAVKIEIDDRIIVDHNMRELFPISERYNEKWTLILTKAIIKLLVLSNPRASIIGSGMVLNALTGMMMQSIRVRNFDGWERLGEFLSDRHYNEKDIVISCYTGDGKRKVGANVVRNREEMMQMMQLENSTFRKRGRKRNSSIEVMNRNREDVVIEKDKERVVQQQQSQQQQKFQQRYLQPNIIVGYSYCLGDYFANGNWKMIYSKDRSKKQQKLRVAYNDMSKVILNKKTRDEKLQHRRKKKQIKELLQIEETKRREMINQPGIRYHFIKLLADLVIGCLYSNREILLGKKCVMNKLEYPPNYQIPKQPKDLEKDREDEKSGSPLHHAKYKNDDEVNPAIDDFSKVENYLELQVRGEDGIWITDKEIIEVFDQIQFYYNPNYFEYKSIDNIINRNPKQFTVDENKQMLVIYKKGNQHLEEVDNNHDDGNIVEIEKINLLFGFGFQQSKWDTLCQPYCMLQKFDFEGYRTASTITTLNKVLSCAYLSINNGNSVFRIYSLCRCRMAYWIACDTKYKLMSTAEYLTEFEGYSLKNFVMEHSGIEKGVYSVVGRVRVRCEGEEGNVLVVRVKRCGKEVEKCISLRVVGVPDKGVYTNEEEEGIIRSTVEQLHLVYEYSRVELQPNRNYYLIIQVYPGENIPEGSIEMAVLSKLSTGVVMEMVEQIEPYKVVERYTVNKYANILKERLFCSNGINVTLVLRIFEGEEGQPMVVDKKGAKKGGKDEPVLQIIEKQMKEKRLVHVKLFKSGILIYHNKGYNEVIISNITLQKTSQNISYYLQAAFDLREWSTASTVSQQTNKIYWSVLVSGEDGIAFVKDTLQESREREIRKSWEEKQVGRAEKGKKARLRYLLEGRLEKGEKLTEEEMMVVNMPKLTKKKQMEEERKMEETKKGGKGVKKEDKKGGKDKKQEVIEEKKQQRTLPLSKENYMNELKQFLTNLQNCQIIRQQLAQNQQPRIRSQQQQKAIRQAVFMAKQNRTAQIARNIELRQMMKIRQKDRKEKLIILLEENCGGFNMQWKQYLKYRVEDQEKDKVKQEKQKLLIEILKQEKVVIGLAEITKLINEYRGIAGYNELLAESCQMVRKNIRIGNITEKIHNGLEGWDIEGLKVVVEEIRTERIEGINQELMGKLNATLEEVGKNPGIVVEKLAELKKMKKGKK